MPFSSGAEDSNTFVPLEPDRARISAGSSATTLSITGAELRLR